MNSLYASLILPNPGNGSLEVHVPAGPLCFLSGGSYLTRLPADL